MGNSRGSGYRCTVTISRINNKHLWWFSSCTKCHRASAPCGNQYKCCGTIEPKYNLSQIGTDGTATAEFTLFGRVAIGRSSVNMWPLLYVLLVKVSTTGVEFEHMFLDLAALVS